MPESGTPPSSVLRFTETEIDLLSRTADALSAWMGKPVLAQHVDATETGFEWIFFAIPLLPEQDPEELVTIQVGGPGAQIIGNKGGLVLDKDEYYDCEYLWAIQLCDLQGVRYIKIDSDGEEVAWTSDLSEILPFDLEEPPAGDSDLDHDVSPERDSGS